MLALLSAPAAADEPLRLRDITVEASPFDVYLPARTTVQREELIDAHKSELSEQLELTPGINVRNGGRGEPRVDMRGFDQRAVLFTLDGVPMYEPYNGIINVDLFPLEMLERVEITRGASSALYGPNGMAGAIKLSSLAPRAPLAGAVSTIWRDSDFWDVRASGAAATEAVSGVLAGRFLTSPGFPLSDDFNERPPGRRRLENGGLRLNSDRDEKSLFASGGWNTTDGGRLYGGFLGSTAAFGIPPSSTQFLPQFRRVDDQDLLHGHVGADQRLTPSIGISGSLFYTGYKLEETQYETVDFLTELLSTTADSHEVGGIGRTTLNLAEQDSLALAAQVRHDWADISDSVNGGLSTPEFTTASVAFENLWLPIEPLAVVVGFSLDLQTGGGRGTDVQPDPQAVVSYDWGRLGSTRAAVARKIRFPTLRELFDPRQGNADVTAEKALLYEIGHQIAGPPGYAQLNLFRADIDDLIINEGDQGVFTNLQDAVQQGIEVAAGLATPDWLQLDVNYTFLDAEARDAGGDFSEIQHKPAHRFNGVGQLKLPFELLLRLEGIYSSTAIDQFGSDVEVGGFGIFNAQVTKFFGEWLSVFAGADNLLDDDHEERLGTPEPGRWVFVGLRLAYQ
jgi:outer membrane receptor protein involved in Fe transport